MIKLTIIFFLWILFFISAHADHEVIYPRFLPVRILGMDQQNALTCIAEAQITAFEHAFSERGYRIKLSTFYTNYVNFFHNEPSQALKFGGIEINENDRLIIDRYGEILPYYMLPETINILHDNGQPTKRPNLSELVVVEPRLPHIKEFQFKQESHIVDLEKLKMALKQKNAVVLGIHSDILNDRFFNEASGLMRPGAYSADTLRDVIQNANKKASSKTLRGGRHVVAVVGYDDELQAIIIRNSWNNQRAIEQSNDVGIANEAFLQFRSKIWSTNLPGYYALPYAYIREINKITDSDFKFWVYELDFESYAKRYFELKKDHPIFSIPFLCKSKDEKSKHISDFQNAFRILKKYAFGSDDQKFRILLEEISGRNIFSIATASSNLNNLLFGRYESYYCDDLSSSDNRKSGELFPQKHHINIEALNPIFNQLSQNPKSIYLWQKIFAAYAKAVISKE